MEPPLLLAVQSFQRAAGRPSDDGAETIVPA